MGAVLLSACASQIPEQIRSAPSPDSPSVSEARSGAQRLGGRQVRWGGTIATVDNRESQTWISVASCHLRSKGRPGKSDPGQGQFMARLEGRLDPAIYSKGRRLTVIGNLDKRKSGVIDEYAYELPMVNVEAHHLWASLPKDPDAHGASLGTYSRIPLPHGPLFFAIF
jgi:outer membrane lipoprotein